MTSTSDDKKKKMQQTVGELNGMYATLFRIILIVLPIGIPTLLAHGVWVTNTIFDLQRFQAVTESNRFTAQDGANLSAAITGMMTSFNNELRDHESIVGHRGMVERQGRDNKSIKEQQQKMEKEIEAIKRGVQENQRSLLRIEALLDK